MSFNVPPAPPGRSLARHGPPSVPAANKAAAVPALSAVFYSLNMLAKAGGGGIPSVHLSVSLSGLGACFFHRRFQLDGFCEATSASIV